MRVLHVLLGLGNGGAERMAANLMRTLHRERFEAGLETAGDVLELGHKRDKVPGGLSLIVDEDLE